MKNTSQKKDNEKKEDPNAFEKMKKQVKRTSNKASSFVEDKTKDLKQTWRNK